MVQQTESTLQYEGVVSLFKINQISVPYRSIESSFQISAYTGMCIEGNVFYIDNKWILNFIGNNGFWLKKTDKVMCKPIITGNNVSHKWKYRVANNYTAK